MPRVSLVTLVALGVVAAPSAARAGIPAWARKYNMNCSGCHAPAAPRLNATGTRFKWAGYRMPEEFDEPQTVEKVQNYLSVRGRLDYIFSKTQGQPTSTSQFAFEDATIFYGGAMGRSYAAFFELERAAEDNVELVANIGGKWGKPSAYGGFRAGQFHWFLREGLAGFDRPTGIRTPMPTGGNLTAGIPFSFAKDQLGVEAFYVAGNNRFSGEVLSGIDAAGVGDEGDPDVRKDFVLIDQYLLDDAGSGIAAVAYFGSLDSVAGPAQTSHFTRFGISANKIVNHFEIQGTVLYGKDTDLPAAFPTPEIKGMGYWVYGGYTIPKSSLTLYGRYEFADPNTDVSDNAKSRFVVGGVLPVNVPEYLRLTAEFAHDQPQASGAAKTNGFTVQLMLNF
jgi:hypothetical protein